MSIRILTGASVAALAWVAAAAGAAAADENLKLVRAPALSPDAKTLAFSYAGDIWLAPASGGEARMLTVHEAHDHQPVWSPDGKTIAFTSNRNGDYDVYLIPAAGGKATRLTWNSGVDVPCCFSPDGKTLLYRSGRKPDFPGGFELYSIPTTGGTPRQVTRAGGTYGVYSPKGDKIAYVRGYESSWRRGYRGAANNDIWLCNADGSDNRRLTDFNGDDSSPMFSADGKFLLFVSDRSGRRNLWKMSLEPGKDGKLPEPEQLTHHASDDARRARISDNGEAVCYEFDHGVWIYNTASQRSTEVRLTARLDDKTNPTAKLTFTAGAAELELSPDNRQVALVIRGEVYVMDAEGGNANSITDNPANDYDIAWSSDSKKLLFVSDREGFDQIYVAESADPKRPELSKARKLKTTKLSSSGEPESNPVPSPDGKSVLYARGNDNLWVMDADGRNARQLVKGPGLSNASWSPDSKWISYGATDSDWGGDIYVIPAAGGRSVNVTRWGTSQSSAQWSQDGRYLVYTANNDDGWQIYAQSLQRPLAEGEVERRDGTVSIDFDDIHKRIRKVVSLNGDERMVAVSPNGKSVAFTANAMGGGDVWVAALDGGGANRLAAGLNPRRLVWGRMGERIWVLDGNGAVRNVAPMAFGGPAGPGGIAPATVGFRAEMELDRSAEFQEMFSQAWRMLNDKFYDPTYHGVDWKAVREKFRPLVDSVVMKEDFQELMLEMCGELNASHLGLTINGRPGGERSGYLGLDFDQSHNGAGLKIKEVVRGGPCDRRGLDIKAGDYLMAVNGKPVGANQDLDRALLGTVGKTTMLSVAPKPDPAGAKEFDIRPVDAGVIAGLSYERWVSRNAAVVDMLSGGKLGYLHMQGMDGASLERFRRELFSDMRGKAGVLIDVRFNGGGFTHDSVLDLLGGKVHTNFVQRGGEKGTVMRNWNRKWSKPALVLVNERSASDAEIFPNAFRRLGLGKLVGKTTMGAVIGTYNVPLIDGSMFRIPRTGVFSAEKEQNLENWGVRPDFEIDVTPDESYKGQDPQLSKAVAVLLADLEGKPLTPPGATTAEKPAAPGPGMAGSAPR